MTISIGGLGPQHLESQEKINDANIDRVTSNATNQTAHTTEAGGEGETTKFTASAANIAALTKLAMNGDDARAEKVEQLRQQVATGTYKPEPSATADALLSEWE